MDIWLDNPATEGKPLALYPVVQNVTHNIPTKIGSCTFARNVVMNGHSFLKRPRLRERNRFGMLMETFFRMAIPLRSSRILKSRGHHWSSKSALRWKISVWLMVTTILIVKSAVSVPWSWSLNLSRNWAEMFEVNGWVFFDPQNCGGMVFRRHVTSTCPRNT